MYVYIYKIYIYIHIYISYWSSYASSLALLFPLFWFLFHLNLLSLLSPAFALPLTVSPPIVADMPS